MSNDNAGRRLKGIWWLSPTGLILCFLIPIFLAIGLLGEVKSPGLTVRGLIFMNRDYSLLGIGIMLLLAVMAYIGQQIRLRPHGEIWDRPWERAAWFLGLVSLVAYLVWFKEILFVPQNLFGMVTGTLRMSRQEIGNAPGVTSLVNFCPVFFSLVTYVWANRPELISRRMRALVITLVFLTIFRVYAWSERLALIELAVAVAVPAGAVIYQRTKSHAIRILVVILPLVGLPMLAIFFGIAEYFRSWQSDFYQGRMEFWEFALGRLASYYYTSLNNGAGLLETQHWPTYNFEYSMYFAHKAPWLFGRIFSYYMEFQGVSITPFLKNYGDMEFNNPSGIYSIFMDVGIPGAIAYFAILGTLSGLMYRAMLEGRARGVLLYPMFFIMLLEIYRYLYFGQSRAFTAILGISIALALISKNKKIKTNT